MDLVGLIGLIGLNGFRFMDLNGFKNKFKKKLKIYLMN